MELHTELSALGVLAHVEEWLTMHPAFEVKADPGNSSRAIVKSTGEVGTTGEVVCRSGDLEGVFVLAVVGDAQPEGLSLAAPATIRAHRTSGTPTAEPEPSPWSEVGEVDAEPTAPAAEPSPVSIPAAEPVPAETAPADATTSGADIPTAPQEATAGSEEVVAAAEAAPADKVLEVSSPSDPAPAEPAAEPGPDAPKA